MLEWLFTALFTLEYALRLACARRPRVYARSFFGLIDLLVVVAYLAATTALGATPTLDQTYQLPYLAHTPMEVPNATVLPIYTSGVLTALEVWAPTQAAGSGWALTAAAKASGLAESAIC